MICDAGSILLYCYNQWMKTKIVGNTHVVQGGSNDVEDLLAILRTEGIETNGNPDLYIRKYVQFGIDEARELRERASLRALGNLPTMPAHTGQVGRRVFIIIAPDLSREAQNALLKTLEESPGNALFFFILPFPETLLLTLRSRVQILQIPSRHIASTRHPSIDVKEFLARAPQKRLEMLKPLLEKDENEKRDMGAVLAFLASLEVILERNPEGLRAVYLARKYVTDKGALVKPLLEQIALLAPRV